MKSGEKESENQRVGVSPHRRVAFYGGSFDPIHNGHLTIARTLIELFSLDEFVFIPAFHAPHKLNRPVTSAFHRYAMLALATMNDAKIKISTVELEAPEKPFTIETLSRLKAELTDSNIFFVMGADSWNEIHTWREWEKLLQLTNFIVVTRPNFAITTTQVTPEITERIVDLRDSESELIALKTKNGGIFITDAVQIDISATAIRQEIHSQSGDNWSRLVSPFIADYIKKYQLYS